jgi:uncharacterized SAM-binding protein YcdF (DUF218 family)
MYELLKTIILPPASPLLVAMLALLLWRITGAGRRWATGSLLLLYLLSTPLVADGLLALLEVVPPRAVDQQLPQGGGAIVILSAESRLTPEFDAPSPGTLTLERLRYGAAVQRATGLAVLVSGGIPSGGSYSLASVMRRSLNEDFRVPVTWVEGQSQDTHQNAEFSAALLKADGVSWVMLVTHAWHMPRAKRAFERAGLMVVAAPTAFTVAGASLDAGIGEWVRQCLPSAKAMQNSYLAFHEILGQIYYRLAYW